jgi:hypothetical protein
MHEGEKVRIDEKAKGRTRIDGEKDRERGR